MKLKELGITLFPEYIQSEGVDAVVETLTERAGATSVTTSPYVAAKAAPGTGHREPPIDGKAGKVRLLDRPLWGQREVWMNAASSFIPDETLYKGQPYRPPSADELTEQQGAIIGEFLDTANASGLQTWLQIQAAIPPGHRVQFGGPVDTDQCLMPDGKAISGRVDNNVSLASSSLRRYMRGFITDLCRQYPQAAGFKFDWPEYPVYQFESLLFDFNPQVASFTERLGLDFESLRSACLAFLGELGSGDIRQKDIALDDIDSFRDSLLAAYPVLADLIEVRSAIVTDYAQFLRDTLNEASDGRCRMFLQCFPPPLNIATGFDFHTMASRCDVIGVKMYTMHWPMIEKNYLQWFEKRTGAAPLTIARALSAILNLSPRHERELDSIRYPEPDQAHPAASDDLIAKLKSAQHEIANQADMVGLAHAYGPVDDFMRRLCATAEGADGAVHINRYCYMSDEKIAALSAWRYSD